MNAPKREACQDHAFLPEKADRERDEGVIYRSCKAVTGRPSAIEKGRFYRSGKRLGFGQTQCGAFHETLGATALN